MGFEKGEGGRPKGAKNKATILGKEFLENYFFGNNNEGLRRHVAEIDAMEYEKDKVTARQKLLEFVLPKQKEIDLTVDMPSDTIKVVFQPTNVKPIQSEHDFIDD
jgi:hypothetical protein